jgi:CxxC motif-containing protein (DUF1111 family)
MVPDENGQVHAGRFGHKASVPNLLFFTITAMFNELGITSPLFPNQHIPSGNQIINPGCQMDANNPEDPAGVSSVSIYQYQAMLGPAPTQPPGPAAQAGQIVFESIGCNLCHTETMQTDPAATIFTDLNGGNMGTVNALANQTVSLYSDLLVHDMRAKSADAAIRTHGGEATTVINNYISLSTADRTNLFAFLKSL